MCACVCACLNEKLQDTSKFEAVLTQIASNCRAAIDLLQVMMGTFTKSFGSARAPGER